MAAQFARVYSNDLHNHKDLITFVAATAGTLNGAAEFVGAVPFSGVDGDAAGNGWELESVILGALTNTTHDTAESITATVEKTDGGTNMLATDPVITSLAGTGARTSLAGTESVAAVVHGTQANRRLADGAGFIVTYTEAGSGGTDPSDVYVIVTFSRIADYDPELTTART